MPMTFNQSLTLGILRADDVRPELVDIAGEYPAMIEAGLLAANRVRSDQVSADQALTLNFKTYNVLRQQYPDDIDEVDAYILTGSKSSVYDPDAWIFKLNDFVRQLDEQKKKLLGLCFGHQLVAHVLGGCAEKASSGWGIGVKDTQLNEAAVARGFGHGSFRLIYSHQDQVVTPAKNAEVLAGHDACPIAMMGLGDHILTFQGHPEFSAEFARAVYELRRELYPPALYQTALESLKVEADHLKVTGWMLDFFVGKK